MKYLINYAAIGANCGETNFNTGYVNAQKLNSSTGISVAGFDAVEEYNKSKLPKEFLEKHSDYFRFRRGAGYWIWKPWIILDKLSKINDGDILMYSDSGCHFISGMAPVFKKLDDLDKKIITFELAQRENQWTKRDCFILMGCDSPEYYWGRQICSTWFLCTKNDFTVNFVKEWYEYMSDSRGVWDKPNELGQPNLEDFRENRHDQSVLSLLCKKHGIKPLEDMSQNGDPRARDFPQIIDHSRKRD